MKYAVKNTPKVIAIEAVIIGSVHLCLCEKSERVTNAGNAQHIYRAILIGHAKPVFIIIYTSRNAVYILGVLLSP